MNDGAHSTYWHSSHDMPFPVEPRTVGPGFQAAYKNRVPYLQRGKKNRITYWQIFFPFPAFFSLLVFSIFSATLLSLDGALLTQFIYVVEKKTLAT